jgi:mannose-6-phosphate isomerase-like protein (cupin superfamily)
MMLCKSVAACPPIIANDGCRVFELLHPAHGDVVLPYSLAMAELGVGERSHRHRLGRTEVYYIVSGHGRMHVDSEVREVAGGDAVVIPAHAVQWIENLGVDPLRFLAIVSPPWDAADDLRLG